MGPGSAFASLTWPGRRHLARPLDLHAILHLLEPGAESFRVAEIRKTLVMRVRAEDPAGMLDRAPVDLGARRHLAHERDRAVGVGAIGAIDLFEGVEIGEMRG